jgi:hypothetical protein
LSQLFVEWQASHSRVVVQCPPGKE